MRKYIILTIVLSCLHIAARGQTIASLDDIDLSALPKPTEAKALRYWFDDDAGSVKTLSQLRGQHTLDVSSLIDGLHTVHYQVVGKDNVVSYIRSDVFMKMGAAASQAQAKSLRYWFDDDASSVRTIANVASTLTLDASSLTEGLHTLHCQVTGSDGSVSYVASGIFMKMDTNTATLTAKKLMYWFDDEAEVKAVDVTQGVQLLDASRLIDGLHTLHYQVLCSNDEMTSTHSSLFMRMSSDGDGVVAKSLRYWFDDAQTATTVSIGQGSQMLDASQLLDGLHTVHYQVLDSKGQLAPPVSSFFMKMGLADSATAKRLRYWFDDDAATVKVIDASKGTQTLDASGLMTGLHTLTCQLIDSEGKVATPYTHLFFKAFDKVVADGENRITQYQYWTNDHSQAMQTVELSKAANPYTLISLLPMQKEPVRSQLFHFEMTNGVPTVYAKNEFHVRFHDAARYFTDDFRPFIDYSVKQEVTDVTLLNPGESHTAAKPGENAIRWYKVNVVRGDSIAFKASNACTMQVFSPSGKELVSAMSPEVLRYNGAYAEEDGTYYVALHDAVALNSDEITIDYQHIDKYAVLSHSPSELGVLPCAQVVSINGNGYDKLKRAALRKGSQSVTTDDFYVRWKSMADMVFVFNGDEEMGKYDLVLTFEEDGVEEELVVKDAIELAAPNLADFKIEISDPRAVASPYPVTVSITNMGNITYTSTPLFMAYDNVDEISDMCFLNFDIDVDSDWVNSGRKLVYETTHFLGKNVKANVIPAFIPVLRPGETKSLKMGFTTGDHRVFNAYAWCGTPWSLSAHETQGALQSMAGQSPTPIVLPGAGSGNGNQMSGGVMKSCVPDPCELASKLQMGMLDCLCGTMMGLGKTLGNLQNALQNERNAAQRKQFDDSNMSEDLDYNALPQDVPLTHPKKILAGWASHCLPSEGLSEEEELLMNQLSDALQKMGEDDCTEPQAHPVNPYNPGDPNDIFGYMAESGSKYIKDGVTDVFYTIEFENDPEIANASAHTIIVKDTLDTSRLDLATFAATRVKIGSKEMYVNGRKSLDKVTMDLRPEVYVVAQVSLSLDEAKGIATWTIESLDPMTMEPTVDAMQGVLPVNTDGRGIGEVSFDIGLKPGLAHGSEVKNRAGIVFDQNGVIMTPTWTNTIDRVKPVSRVVDAQVNNGGETAAISIEASDEGSGPWRYDVYVQYGSGAWFVAAENVAADTTATVKLYDGIVHHFYCVARDMAGNAEQKEPRSELTLTVSERMRGDTNGDGKVDVADIAEIIDVMAHGDNAHRADVNGDGRVDVADIASVIDIMAAMARAAGGAEE